MNKTQKNTHTNTVVFHEMLSFKMISLINHGALKGKKIGPLIKAVFKGRFTFTFGTQSNNIVLHNPLYFKHLVCCLIQALQPIPPMDQTADFSFISTVSFCVTLGIFRLKWQLI